MSIANQVATLGSAGLLGSEQTLAGWVSTAAAPRFTGLNDIPLEASGIPTPASTITFPFTPNASAEAFTNVVDDGVRTPHSSQIVASVQRQLPGGWTLETDYVGRFGRRTLQNMDFAMPLNLVDPTSGMDYFTAADLLETEHYKGIPTANIAKIPYWENLFPDAANLGVNCTQGVCQDGNSATQNIYNHFATNPLNASYGIYSMDVLCNPGCGNGHYNRYFASQFSSAQTMASIGTTSYNSGQLILRHPMSHGLQADISYTYGQSIDLGSDSERVGGGAYIPSSFTGYTSFSQILDAFHPRKNRAVSDYDTRHLATFDWVYELPLGHGRQFLSSANGVVDALLGGWQMTGLGRVTSGLPFAPQIGAGWVTSWDFQSFLVKTGPVPMHRHVIPGQSGPNAFADPLALSACIEVSSSCPVRYPLPGEAGTRNAFRGDGVFGIDSGLNKAWHLKEGINLKFGWEVFNITNTPRFDVNPNTSLQSVWGNGDFGVYSKQLPRQRIQQFSLRIDF